MAQEGPRLFFRPRRPFNSCPGGLLGPLEIVPRYQEPFKSSWTRLRSQNGPPGGPPKAPKTRKNAKKHENASYFTWFCMENHEKVTVWPRKLLQKRSQTERKRYFSCQEHVFYDVFCIKNRCFFEPRTFKNTCFTCFRRSKTRKITIFETRPPGPPHLPKVQITTLTRYTDICRYIYGWLVGGRGVVTVSASKNMPWLFLLS